MEGITPWQGDAEGSQGPCKDLRCYVGGRAWGALWVWERMGQNWEQKKGEMCVGNRDLEHEVTDPQASRAALQASAFEHSGELHQTYSREERGLCD